MHTNVCAYLTRFTRQLGATWHMRTRRRALVQLRQAEPERAVRAAFAAGEACFSQSHTADRNGDVLIEVMSAIAAWTCDRTRADLYD